MAAKRVERSVEITCLMCYGSGWVTVRTPFAVFPKTCSGCKGTGKQTVKVADDGR